MVSPELFTRLPLVLASGSAARRVLLEGAGLVFEVRPVAVDEAALRDSARAEGGTVEEAALLLADAKAARVRDPAMLVIAADQILECDGQWFEKPADLAAARLQLLALRGRTHRLVSAVVCWRGGNPVWHHLDSASLTMRNFSDAFLDAYLAAEGDALLGSVGCYRLEGPGVQLFDRVTGVHTTILGLPLLPLLGFLRQHGALLG
jgi:septum formation protein